MKMRALTLSTILTVAGVIFMILHPINLSAQEQFDLMKRGGHYYFTSTINDTHIELMVESGIPALLIGEDIYESCLKSSGLSFQPSEQKIRLLNNLYDIKYKADGEIRIGNALYDGPIFILEKYEGAAVPMQNLKDPDSKASTVTIDLKNGYLHVGNTNKGIEGKTYRLSLDRNMGFPIVRSSVDIETAEGLSRLKGDVIIDFGNPSLLFLMKHHKSMTKAISRGLKLKDAYNRQGQIVAQGIYADEISLLGRKYHDISIGVTDKMKGIRQLGFLGTPFFSSPVTFDFDNNFMVIHPDRQHN